MNAMKTRWCRRKDLREFRGLSDQNRTGFLLVLEWFENFRLRHEREAGREAARIFWKNDVLSEDRQREPWQLEQWEAAIQWYLIRRLRPPAHPSRVLWQKDRASGLAGVHIPGALGRKFSLAAESFECF